MPDPEPQGGPPPAATQGPRRPGGCLRACVVLLGLGFMLSLALLMVVLLYQDWFVGQFVESQVSAFQRALEQTQIRKDERERGEQIARDIGEAIKNGKVTRDENVEPWPRIEKILSDFRTDTDNGQKVLTPVQARTYIDRMQEVLDDLKGKEPPQPH